MSDFGLDLVGAGFVFADRETGKIVFEMKKKDQADYGGEGIYYIFKIYEENFSDIDAKDIWMHDAWPTIKAAAGMLGVGLFELDEMGERMREQVGKLLDDPRTLRGEQVDVKIEVMDHATGDIGSLVIGVTMRKEPI